MTDLRSKPDWRPLALMLATLTACYAVIYRLVPFDVRAFLLFPFGAWALYCGARLPFRVAMPLTFGVFLATDLVLYRASHYTPNYTFYLCLLFSLVLGRALLVRSQNPARIAGGALGGYAFFFLVSNFAAWLEPAREYYRPHTFSTLMQAYWEGLVFLRMQPGHLVGDFVLSFGLFGMHALLAKAYFPAEEITLESAQ